MIDIKETEQGVRLRIHVIPQSQKSEVVGIQDDALKVKIAAPPVEGRANAACIRFLSDILGVRKNQISIVSGHKSRDKIVAIEGIRKREIQTVISGFIIR